MLVAWFAAALGSALPFIVWRELLSGEPPWWLLPALLLILLALAAAPRVGRVRPYVLVMAGLVAGNGVKDLVSSTAVFQAWSVGASDHERLFVDPFLELIPLAGVAVASAGLTRNELYLTAGDLSLPARVGRLGMSWRWATALLAAMVAVPLLLQLTFTVMPNLMVASRAVAALPAAFLFAALNAAGEEFRFRAAPFARLVPLLGTAQALALTSFVFALGHFYGHPSGLSGVVLAGVAGAIFGLAMRATRGFLAPWLIHGVQDVLIFAAVVMGER